MIVGDYIRDYVGDFVGDYASDCLGDYVSDFVGAFICVLFASYLRPICVLFAYLRIYCFRNKFKKISKLNFLC